ncbi:LuxR family transcriptional regulator [Saccharothrix sp. NRRL B-16348]|uniref:helix-turn-helix transcriptional regulator n=1 Tax=Saccharothrix sp. NRRL B-16348 TaxID=1415542 RepID=UPI0006AF25DD|nr:response regulator transcription factor [Saccharothrix sp. NRRL B-16348]KOX16044.1 LuxR family transcriptional regulator [Saccharothrix sp. NRRL B-16348]
MSVDHVTVLRGEEELFGRTAHLFATASEITCAARDLNTWAATHRHPRDARQVSTPRLRKLFRPGVLLNPSTAQHVRWVSAQGAAVRITPDDINETIIIDRRFAILAGDLVDGRRDYGVVTEPTVVQNVASLFDAAWRSATDLAVYDAQHAELRALAPRVLELLASGCKDETAARTLGLGVRTYRRRVAELMTALGAESRFQAGARARDLGLI